MYTDKEIEDWKKAGHIAGTARSYGASLIKVGTSLLEVTEAVEKKIIELGGNFAFPPQISLNNIAAHYCADPDDPIIFKEGDVAKIDVGVHINGFIGDTAETVDLGNNQKLVEASKKALENAISILKPGLKIGEIGKVIQDTIKNYGMLPVKNLSGHGLDKFSFHASPSIPNIHTNDETRLEKGQVIAIEPFATSGIGLIHDTESGNIFSQISNKPIRNIISRKILKEIHTFKGLPFTTRWLIKKFNPVKVNFALRDLLNHGIITIYAPLPENSGALVSQAEHTIIIDDPIIITTKTD